MTKEHYSTGEICIIHESCDGEQDDCRTSQDERPWHRCRYCDVAMAEKDTSGICSECAVNAELEMPRS